MFEPDQFLDRGGCEEGNYTAYAWFWDSLNLPLAPNVVSINSFIATDELQACIADSLNLNYVVMATGVVTTFANVVLGTAAASQCFDESIYGTYVAVMDIFPFQTVRMYRRGVLIATFVLVAPDRFYGLVMSPTGRYIIALCDSGANVVFRCYRGA